MKYRITNEKTEWGFTGRRIITVDGEEVGEITPLYGSPYAERAKGYRIHVMLEHDEISPDAGDYEHRTLAAAEAAVHAFMSMNGVDGNA